MRFAVYKAGFLLLKFKAFLGEMGKNYILQVFIGWGD